MALAGPARASASGRAARLTLLRCPIANRALTQSAGHQHIGVAPPARGCARLRQGVQKQLPIGVRLKNRLALIAPAQDMVRRAGTFNSRAPRHGGDFNLSRPGVKAFCYHARTDPSASADSVF